MAYLLEGHVVSTERKVVGEKNTPVLQVLMYDINQREENGKNILVNVSFWESIYNLDTVEKFLKKGSLGKVLVDEVKQSSSTQNGNTKIFYNATAVPFGFLFTKNENQRQSKQNNQPQAQQQNYQNNQQNYQNQQQGYHQQGYGGYGQPQGYQQQPQQQQQQPQQTQQMQSQPQQQNFNQQQGYQGTPQAQNQVPQNQGGGNVSDIDEILNQFA